MNACNLDQIKMLPFNLKKNNPANSVSSHSVVATCVYYRK